MWLEFANILLGIFGSLGYFGIIILMTVESCFLPFPSELVMIPGGYLAHQGELNFFLVIIAGTIGAIFGALINYYLAKYLGRAIIYNLLDTRIAKILLINKRKVEKSERLFNKYGKLSTFFGRLIPAVRQLISIPAGLARMNLKAFVVCTAGGALIWNVFLTLLGYQFGANQEKLNKYLHDFTIGGIILLILLIIYIFYHYHRKRIKKRIAEAMQLDK